MVLMRKLIFLLTTILGSIFAGPKFMSNGSMLKLNSPNSMLWINEPIANFDGTVRMDNESYGRIVASTVVFDRGVMRTDLGAEFYYTGTFNFNYYNQMFLTDGCFIDFKSGLASKAVVVSANTTATIVGSPEFMFDLSLTDSSSTLLLGLQKKMDANLNLNAGTVILKDDLRFKEGCRILGGGTMDINNRSLRITGGNFANAPITFLNASGVFFDADTTISQYLTFKGTSFSSKISGGSFAVTFGDGGRIILPDSNSRLEITNMVLKGFGDGPTGGDFDIHPTSTISLQDCTIEMSGNYTHAQGTIEFRDGCRIVHQGNTFSVQPGGYLSLHGASLIYDSLNKADKNPFIFSNEAAQKLVLNGGEIRSSSANSPLVLEGTEVEFYNDHNLTLQSSMRIVNNTPASPQDVNIDFNGHALTFPVIASPVFKIDANTVVTINNVELFDYNKESISYGDANSKLKFGYGVKIKLFKTETIAATDQAWEFVGHSIISGKGAALTLEGSQKIRVGAGSTLTLEDLRLVITDADSLKMLSATSKIVFDNCDLILQLENGLEIDNGNIDVIGKLRVFGGDAADANISSRLSFFSSGFFKVKNASLLRFGQNVIFEYRASPAADGGSLFASKRHFILEGATSVLELDGCTLHSTQTGLALDHGKVVVSDSSSFIIDGSGPNAAELGSAVDFYIKPSVSFSVTGTLVYNHTA